MNVSGHSEGETPEPISNSEVKPFASSIVLPSGGKLAMLLTLIIIIGGF